MRRLCPFCQNDLNDVWQAWKTEKAFDETMVTICMTCGEIVMVARDGLRKPTTDEHITLANNGGVTQARQLWLEAREETEQASSEIASEFKGLLHATHDAPDDVRLLVEGVYWRAAKATYATLVGIFAEEKQTLPSKLVDRLELIGTLILSGDADTKERLRAADSPLKKRKATRV